MTTQTDDSLFIKYFVKPTGNDDEVIKQWQSLKYNGKMPPIDTIFEGVTALSYQTQNGSIKTMTWLLNNGANPNKKDESGKSPLDIASLNRDEEKIKLFLEYRRDPAASLTGPPPRPPLPRKNNVGGRRRKSKKQRKSKKSNKKSNRRSKKYRR